MYSLFVGEDVIENIHSPTPGTETIAHWPGRCSNGFFPSVPTTRKVLTSGVSLRISVMTPILGIRFSLIMLFSSYRLDYFHDIQTLRALIDAPPAPHAGIQSVVLSGIIHEFMHEPLAIPLHLRRAAVCRRHQRKIRVHTGIPLSLIHI